MNIGVLNITIIKGIDLFDSDYLGKSDPYVTVQVGNFSEHPSAVRLKLNTFVASINAKNEAIWNERLVFQISAPDMLDLIQFQVWDKDEVGNDDLLFLKDVSPTLKGKLIHTEESLDFIEFDTEKGKLQVLIHYMPFTVVQKLFSKLNNVAEELKKKLIAQLITFVTGAF